jgi:hypothetical protein
LGKINICEISNAKLERLIANIRSLVMLILPSSFSKLFICPAKELPEIDRLAKINFHTKEMLLLLLLS